MTCITVTQTILGIFQTRAHCRVSSLWADSFRRIHKYRSYSAMPLFDHKAPVGPVAQGLTLWLSCWELHFPAVNAEELGFFCHIQTHSLYFTLSFNDMGVYLRLLSSFCLLMMWNGCLTAGLEDGCYRAEEGYCRSRAASHRQFQRENFYSCVVAHFSKFHVQWVWP